jgi:plastocyanin
VLLPEDAATFDSGDLYAGDRWVYRFDIPGTYVYFCQYDEENGMIGTITVTDSASV